MKRSSCVQMAFWAVLIVSGACTAQTNNAAEKPQGVMPTLPQIVQVIDKASSGESTDEPAEWSTPVKLVAIFTLLAILPSVLAMMTSFTRITIVLSFVRRALSTQTIPPNIAMMGLAIFLTLYTMAPTFYKMNEQAIQPYIAGEMDSTQASLTASRIIKEFMLRQTRQTDLARFVQIAKIEPPQSVTDLPLHIVIPSFIISEFRTAFEIGCLMFIPFLLLDLVIASVLLTAGMMMLPPVMISLPFKIILFILIDGWGILAQSLSLSFR
ncbi:MAG TPA: flagellar type III secretion system pore protein FliP [Anaerohalosphaeraceae bacterium]|jgi:flagellar biosynthetic protein FliP|nr:flagellar type III secretion system pore protein FliP [Anaerohalosphaeraceae bacterium]HRT49448.1 flagellar type III secretion system pore protein FliP [Anaerohalosphaeraceae bacterium]HRT85388.1 flagellar type III secretion system pore protein FliP [Anaerohalosphaeraceae bacterium]